MSSSLRRRHRARDRETDVVKRPTRSRQVDANVETTTSTAVD